jgi:two-component system chemotaxis response regulator CheV
MILVENNEFLFILDLERILEDLENLSANPSGIPMNFSGQGSSRQLSEDKINEAARDEKFGRGRRVLLVDDSPLILKNVTNLLSKIGFEVTNVNNGEKAYEELTKNSGSKKPIEIVVTDVEMPSMDGLTLTRKIRENEKLSSLPVVLHTSLSGKAIREAAEKCGADGYAVKNDFATLVSFLKQAG